MTNEIYLSRAALHMWEEPPISGTNGSGTIFFSGCSLSCVFCQNVDISRGRSGKSVSVERLAEIMIELQQKGAHNINLVTPTHYIPSIAEAIPMARRKGLTIPIVYNTGSYDTVDTVRMLDGLVDIYLPDLKYYRNETAKRLSYAEDYPSVARLAIAEMM
jgi:putative pyruvate formate lyase activating enzyme